MARSAYLWTNIETRYRRNWEENFEKDSDKEFCPNFGKRIIDNIVPSQIYIFGISRYRLEERAEL